MIEVNLKSQKLTEKEHQALLKWIVKQPTKAIAARRIGIDRATLHRISFSASAKPETVKAIRVALKSKQYA